MNFTPDIWLVLVCIFFLSATFNTIYALIVLIFIYIIGAVMYFGWNAEYFALVTLIIYAGALAILFVFTVMMLKLKVKHQKINWKLFWILTTVFILLLTIVNNPIKYHIPKNIGIQHNPIDKNI